MSDQHLRPKGARRPLAELRSSVLLFVPSPTRAVGPECGSSKILSHLSSPIRPALASETSVQTRSGLVGRERLGHGTSTALCPVACTNVSHHGWISDPDTPSTSAPGARRADSVRTADGRLAAACSAELIASAALQTPSCRPLSSFRKSPDDVGSSFDRLRCAHPQRRL